ncbi:hypothetical protein [Gryllotalpicola koreensis]
MSATTVISIIAIAALIGYALYRQTRTSQVTRGGRYKMAIIYGIIGVCLGVNISHNPAALGLTAISLAASAGVGVLRAQRTRLWRDDEGRVFTRGTRTTAGLFLALIAFKVALGTFAYFVHVPYDANVGEVMVMLALMLAVQATIVWRRIERLGWAPAPRAHGGQDAPVAAQAAPTFVGSATAASAGRATNAETVK